MTNGFLESVNYGCVLVAQSCLTLCDPMDCSPPGSSVHGILQTRIPEWAAIPFSRGTSRPRDGTTVSRIADKFFSLSHQGSLLCIERSLNRWTTKEVSTYFSYFLLSCLSSQLEFYSQEGRGFGYLVTAVSPTHTHRAVPRAP